MLFNYSNLMSQYTQSSLCCTHSAAVSCPRTCVGSHHALKMSCTGAAALPTWRHEATLRALAILCMLGWPRLQSDCCTLQWLDLLHRDASNALCLQTECHWLFTAELKLHSDLPLLPTSVGCRASASGVSQTTCNPNFCVRTAGQIPLSKPRCHALICRVCHSYANIS